MKRRSDRSSKIDLEAMVLESEPRAYEALELYKSRANRLKLKGEFDQALDSLSQGILVFLSMNYYTCAAELIERYIGLLQESNKSLTVDIRNMINQIDGAFCPANHASRYQFLQACVKWSVAIGTRKYGDPLLQAQLGSCIWSMGEFKRALSHFAAAEAPDRLWMLIEEQFGTEANSKEREEITVLGVLHFLALENLRDANDLWRKYKCSLPEKISKSELHIFVDYLLLTCCRDAAPLFKTLCKKYERHLDFDPAVRNILHGPIATKLFKIQSTMPSIFSMFSDMMNNGAML